MLGRRRLLSQAIGLVPTAVSSRPLFPLEQAPLVSTPPNLTKQLEAYRELMALAAARPLADEENQRLELLRDLLLEAQIALDVADGLPRRTPRAPLNLDVSFTTSNDAARAFTVTRDIGTGGMSFGTDMDLAKGTVLNLSIKVPGWPEPVQVNAEVMWCRGGAVGLAFQNLDAALEKRVKILVTEHSSFIERLGASLGARKAPAKPSVSERQTIVLVRVREAAVATSTMRAIASSGLVAVDGPTATPPVAIVADSSSALEMTEKYPGVPLILVHVSGPESLVGRLSRLVPEAFIPRPATDEAVLEAIRRVIARG
jgi:hypothetical protein